MDFAQPRWFWLLLLLPPLGLAVAIASRRRLRGWRALALPGRPTADGGAAWLIALALLTVALAQPRWGRGTPTELPPGRDVVLLVDASWSMAAEDVIPNRLGRAAEAAEELTRSLGRNPGDRVSVVAFAGRGVIRCPLTSNLGAVVEALRSLRPGAIEPGGSDLAAGLDAALDALDNEPRAGGRIVVAFSDGEDQVPHWPTRVDRLRALGVVVHAVAIGDADRAHPIPLPSTGTGADRPLADPDGRPVETSRVDLELRGLSLATGGAFVPLGIASADLAELYERRIAPAERRVRADETRSPDRVERFGLFLLAGMAVGLIGSWPRKRRAVRPRPWWKSWAVLGVASALVSSAADRVDPVERAVDEGRNAFSQGDLEGALSRFDRAGALAPRDPIPDYNAAATLYRMGRFEEARSRYLASRERADARLRTKIDYALGNVAVALRDIPAALRHYDDCIGSTTRGPAFDRIRGFARDNRAFAERLSNPGASTTEEEGGDAPADGDGDSEGNGDGGGDEEDEGNEQGADGGDGDGGSSNGQDGSSDGSGMEAPEGSTPVPGTGVSSGSGPRGNSPSDRLSRAVNSIRESRERRLPDLPPAPPPGSPDRPRW